MKLTPCLALTLTVYFDGRFNLCLNQASIFAVLGQNCLGHLKLLIKHFKIFYIIKYHLLLHYNFKATPFLVNIMRFTLWVFFLEFIMNKPHSSIHYLYC